MFTQTKQPVPEVKRKAQIVRVQNIDFLNLRAKGKMDYNDGQNNINAHYDMRIRKDSIIWISISPGLGVEVVRAIITKDSLWAMNRIDKVYYAYSLQEFSAKFDIPLTYNLIQSALIGNTPFVQDSTDEVITEGGMEIIKKIMPSVSMTTYVSELTLKMEKLSMVQTKLNNTLVFTYRNFTGVNNFLIGFHNQISLKYINEQGLFNTTLFLEHNKIELDEKELKFPFAVPSKYSRK